jgi:hypothetical protein
VGLPAATLSRDTLLVGGVAVVRQARPVQRIANGRLVRANEPPTAHAWWLLVMATADKTEAVPTLGLGTRAQVRPFQCSVTVRS